MTAASKRPRAGADNPRCMPPPLNADPLLAVHLSRLEALPYQIGAVYQEMLPGQPLRLILDSMQGTFHLVPYGCELPT
jgi:hypothetical protein